MRHELLEFDSLLKKGARGDDKSFFLLSSIKKSICELMWIILSPTFFLIPRQTRTALMASNKAKQNGKELNRPLFYVLLYSKEYNRKKLSILA